MEKEMKATLLLIVLLGAAMTILAPHAPRAAGGVSVRADEPVWMVLSGAALLGLASALRRRTAGPDAPNT
jgi:hypothetical protein